MTFEFNFIVGIDLVYKMHPLPVKLLPYRKSTNPGGSP